MRAVLEQTRREAEKELEELRNELRAGYLTGDQQRLLFVSRDETLARGSRGREAMLVLCALTGTIGGVVSVILSATGHH